MFTSLLFRVRQMLKSKRRFLLPDTPRTGNDNLEGGSLSGRSLRVLQLMRSGMGVGSLCVPIAAALRAKGYEVEFACAIEPLEEMPPPEATLLHPLPLSRRVGALGLHLRALWACVRLMRERKYDIVHVHELIASMIGRLAAFIAGVPAVIYHARGSLYESP